MRRLLKSPKECDRGGGETDKGRSTGVQSAHVSSNSKVWTSHTQTFRAPQPQLDRRGGGKNNNKTTDFEKFMTLLLSQIRITSGQRLRQIARHFLAELPATMMHHLSKRARCGRSLGVRQRADDLRP